jgi:hypothetical protein
MITGIGVAYPQQPAKIVKEWINPVAGLRPFEVNKIGYGLGLDPAQVGKMRNIVSGLYKAFYEKDCLLAEINPLVLTKGGEFIALDAKMNFDDNGLFRHKDIAALRDLNEEAPLEVEASKYNLNYIRMDGNVGCMVNGAGLAMATMDVIKLAGGMPANFLDVGGGATVEMVKNGLKNLWIFLIDSFTVLCARTLGKPLIHVVGDSHVTPFRGSIAFLAHHLGATTVYNLNKGNSTTKSYEKLFKVIDKVGEMDIVMLCFGEIDCRIHIYYQHKKSNEKYSINELIDRTISHYGLVMAQLKERGVNFCVCCVSPATKVENEYKYPFYGTPQIRSQINRTFNEKLRAFCETNSYKFIDIYDKVADKDGLMLQEYAGDEIHLNRKAVALVRAELREKLGIDI